jgi:hypothetical protein
MYQLQLVVVQQAAEEISHREVEAVLEEGREDDLLLDIFARELQDRKSATTARKRRKRKRKRREEEERGMGQPRLGPLYL